MSKLDEKIISAVSDHWTQYRCGPSVRDLLVALRLKSIRQLMKAIDQMIERGELEANFRDGKRVSGSLRLKGGNRREMAMRVTKLQDYILRLKKQVSRLGGVPVDE